MRNIHNALADVMEKMNGYKESNVVEEQDRWVIEIVGHNDELLKVEILIIENEPVGCVLECKNIRRGVMNRFMDALMDELVN